MADEQDRAAAAGHLRHAIETLRLEFRVADRQHFIHDEDLRLEVSGDGKGETDVHAHRVALHRRVDELADARELDDLVEPPPHLDPAHAEDRAIQENVLAATQLWMEAGTALQGTIHATIDPDAPCVGSVIRDSTFSKVDL